MNHREDEFQPLERSLTDFFADVRRSERAPSGLWERIESRIGDEAERAPGARARRGQRIPRWLGAIGFAASLALVAVVLLNLPGRGSVASAEEIIERAQTTARTPATAGIQSIVAEQRFVRYFFGTDTPGVPAIEATARTWYEAPNLQRLEYSWIELDADGRSLSEHSSVSVWDGSEYWTYDSQEGIATVLRQDPDVDTFEQLTLSGILPSQDAFLDEPSCREASVTGEEEVAGRTTDVVELSPSTCGFTLPGSDGRRVLAVDQETGLVLRMTQYAANGRLALLAEITALEINGEVAGELLSFTAPSSAEVRDRRDEPVGGGFGFRIEPRLMSLEDARAMTTFPLRTPAILPAGFELQSVELWWPGVASEDRPKVANDWVLLRYGDDAGNWLLVSQGFGGFLPGLASTAPEDERGTVEVRGAEAEWFDGSPLGTRWEPGTMRLLNIDAGRVGGGWAIGPDGETLTGSPLHIALASNRLSVGELVEIAEGLKIR